MKLGKSTLFKKRDDLCKEIKSCDNQETLAKLLGCSQSNVSQKLNRGSINVTELMVILHNYPEKREQILKQIIY